MKLAGKVYKGIHYVELRDLPQDHQQRIIATYGNECLIKILVDHSVIKNCLQYKDYETWYKTSFMLSEKSSPVVAVNGSLILDASLKSIPNS